MLALHPEPREFVDCLKVNKGDHGERGYRVLPKRCEFWSADKDFVHDRFEYLRSRCSWRRRRLQP